ncbi:MAG: molybdopterin-dependent oxidoreductase [Aggregatilineaceae bacterium]
MKLQFLLNGQPVCIEADPDMVVLDLLRDHFRLTGAKPGCGIGVCGTCAVLLDGHAVNSCTLRTTDIHGREVVTIEGIHGPDGGLSDVQRALLDHGAIQCGYCTPGMVIAAEALLQHTPEPTRDDIRAALAGHLCRCTGYQQIVDAIETAARWRRGFALRLAERSAESQELSYVGRPAQPVDGEDKVTGRAKYVGDYQLPGMLVAAVLRCPVPHARITRLDVSPALEVPGVVAAITANDFVDHGHFGWPVKDAYILAYEKARFVGDPVAAVAAETLTAAKAGLAAIRFEYQELPGVLDMEQALAPDAPLIPLESPDGRGNLCYEHRVRNGEAAPQGYALTLDETYTCSHQEHAYLETEGALAIPDPDGGITVYANDQSPYINRDNLVTVLGLPVDKVRVIQAVVGGSFGGKDDIGYQCSAQAAKLALKSGRPVRLTLTREESMLASYKREAMRYRVQLGADTDGTLRAARVHILTDSGAYASMTPLAAWRATVHAAGAYRYDAVTVDTQVVYTNNGYSGAFRGFGNTESVAVIEQAIDELAHRLGRDPLEFRLQNVLRQGDRTMTGHRLEHEIKLAECLTWVRDRSDWDRKRAAYAAQPADWVQRRGIGVACYFHGSSLGGEGADYATAALTVEAGSSITLASGLTDYGQGSRTVFTLIAAETLGVKPSRIHMRRPDTQHPVESGPTVASRSTIVGGNAVRVAATRLDSLLRTAAADALNCAPDQITRYGEYYIGPSKDVISFQDVAAHARTMGIVLSASGHWRVPHFEWDFEKGTGIPYFCYVFGAQVAEVEVNLNTGQTRVLSIWAAHDGGKIIFPQGAYGQMYGGIAQGIGYALLEDMRWEQGYPAHLNFDGYHIPSVLDMPVIEATFIESRFEDGPYGAKNLAEPTMIATAPAILNAIYQATGVRRRRLPLTPERLLHGRDLPVPEARQRALAALGFVNATVLSKGNT